MVLWDGAVPASSAELDAPLHPGPGQVVNHPSEAFQGYKGSLWTRDLSCHSRKATSNRTVIARHGAIRGQTQPHETPVLDSALEMVLAA